MDTPIFNTLKYIADEGRARFYMPGHKGKDIYGVYGDVLKYDVTEIVGADNLYQSDGVIDQCEKNLAEYYGAKKTLISCGGSTLCIQTMLTLVRNRGKTLIVARNIHVSAANAIAMLGFEPLWVYPEYNTTTGTNNPVTPKQIEFMLEISHNVAAVYITSPDYFGTLSDIEGIAEVCRRNNVPLVVDNAHGAHLKAAGYKHPIEQGAAMCCDSAHKTLPVLTGGAYLHIGDESYMDNAKDCMSIFGSTSPNYLIMMSVDLCCKYLVEQAEADFSALKIKIEQIENIATAKGFIFPTVLRDRTRLTLCAAELGYTGERLAEYLQRYEIEPEYVGESTVVLLSSPQNSDEDFARLTKAIEEITPTGERAKALQEPVRTTRELMPREALFSKRRIIKVDDALGRVASVARTKCPPGVPIVMPGEIITTEVIDQLKNYGVEYISVIEEVAAKG